MEVTQSLLRYDEIHLCQNLIRTGTKTKEAMHPTMVTYCDKMKSKVISKSDKIK